MDSGAIWCRPRHLKGAASSWARHRSDLTASDSGGSRNGSGSAQIAMIFCLLESPGPGDSARHLQRHTAPAGPEIGNRDGLLVAIGEVLRRSQRSTRFHHRQVRLTSPITFATCGISVPRSEKGGAPCLLSSTGLLQIVAGSVSHRDASGQAPGANARQATVIVPPRSPGRCRHHDGERSGSGAAIGAASGSAANERAKQVMSATPSHDSLS